MAENGEEKLVGAIAETTLQAVMFSLQHLLTEVASLTRWLLATLITLNGGGMIAIANIETIRVQSALWAAISYLIGLFFAVLTAALLIKFVLPVTKSLGELIAHLSVSKQTGVWNFEKMDKISTISDKQKSQSKTLWTLGWISFACFAAGSTVILCDSISEKQSTAQHRFSDDMILKCNNQSSGHVTNHDRR